MFNKCFCAYIESEGNVIHSLKAIPVYRAYRVNNKESFLKCP